MEGGITSTVYKIDIKSFFNWQISFKRWPSRYHVKVSFPSEEFKN